MRLGFRGRIFLVSMALIGLGAAISGALSELWLRDMLEEQITESLARQAGVAAERLAIAPATDMATIDALADRLRERPDARVTIIDSQGVVLGDSQVDAARLPEVENHGTRPEVRAALTEPRATPGVARRKSATVGDDLLYVAVPARRLDGDEGVIRFAMPLRHIEQIVGRLRLLLGLAGLAGMGAAVFLSGFASHLVSRDLRTLVVTARRMAEATGRAPITNASPDDIVGLVRSLQRLGDELDQTVRDLGAERNRLSAVLAGMQDGVLAIDGTGRLTLVNRAGLSLLDLAVAPLGRTLGEMTRAPALAVLAARALEGFADTAELELSGPGQRERHILARATPQEGGGCVVMLQDDTELRRLERVRQDFVASVSHELRTPVAALRLNADELQDGGLDDPEMARGFVDAIARNAERLGSLIDDLLALARLEAGQSELQLTPVALDATAARVADALHFRATQRRQTLRVAIPAGLRAMADERALGVVLTNLLDNAIKYGADGGRVTVAAVFAGERVRVEVTDDGPGVARRHRDRLFERFYRADPGRSRQMGGTGLGLAIVKHMVEIMGGEVGMRPATPTGAVFWFTLPSVRPGGEGSASTARPP